MRYMAPQNSWASPTMRKKMNTGYSLRGRLGLRVRGPGLTRGVVQRLTRVRVELRRLWSAGCLSRRGGAALDCRGEQVCVLQGLDGALAVAVGVVHEIASLVQDAADLLGECAIVGHNSTFVRVR